MSFESRIVRPFHRTSLDEALTSATFHFGNQVCEANAGIAVADPETFARSIGRIVWAPEGEFEDFKVALVQGASDLGVDLSALGLLAVASTSYVRRSQVVHRCPLTDLDSLDRVTEVTAGERPVALRTGFHGAAVEVYLLLLRELEKRPLRPWRKATWISRAKFTIDVEKGAVLFRPIPLDDNERARLDLPAGTVRYVDLEDHDVLEPFGESEPPRFYIDADLLRQLGARQASPIALAFQAQLAQDFMTAVVHRAAGETDVETRSWEDVEDSLLGRVLRFAAGAGASRDDKQLLLKQVSENPERMLARTEPGSTGAVRFWVLARPPERPPDVGECRCQ